MTARLILLQVKEPYPYIARGVDNLKRFIQAGVLTTNNLSFFIRNRQVKYTHVLSQTYQKELFLIPN